MTINLSPGDEPEGRVEKRPYEKPSFRYEEVFVTSALTCAKVTGGSCALLLPPRSS